jgi:mRNA interferase YafQ
MGWTTDLLELNQTAQFKKDLKRVVKRRLSISKIDEVVLLLRKQQPLPPKYHDHALTGDYIGYRECHILPDWLLIYAIDDGKLILTASRTGSHADLF